MEELFSALLERHLSGYEPIVNRYDYQGKEHFQTMLKDLAWVKKVLPEKAQKKEISRNWARIDFSS